MFLLADNLNQLKEQGNQGLQKPIVLTWHQSESYTKRVC